METQRYLQKDIYNADKTYHTPHVVPLLSGYSIRQCETMWC